MRYLHPGDIPHEISVTYTCKHIIFSFFSNELPTISVKKFVSNIIMMYMYTYIIVKSQLHSLVVLVVSIQLTLSGGIVYIFISLYINNILNIYMC